jgi:hypothetical protein
VHEASDLLSLVFVPFLKDFSVRACNCPLSSASSADTCNEGEECQNSQLIGFRRLDNNEYCVLDDIFRDAPVEVMSEPRASTA